MKRIIEHFIKLYNKNEMIINYLIIGGLTTVVNLISKYVLLFTIFDAKKTIELQFTIIISWIIAVTFAYVTNRKIVFKSKNQNVMKELINFFNSRVMTLVVEMIFMYIFVTIFKLNTESLVAILSIISQVIVIILNYIFSKMFVFKVETQKT